MWEGPPKTTGLIDRRWTPRKGVEPTGTNGPTDPTPPFPFFCGAGRPPGRGSKTTRVRYAIPESHTRPQGRAGSGPASVAAAIAAGTRPDFPFPNPEAKTASADGTAPARVWERRTPPPTQTHKRRGPAPAGPLLSFAPHPQTEHPHTAGHIPSRPHNPNPTARRTGGNQTGLARTEPLTPKTQKEHTHRPMRQGT